MFHFTRFARRLLVGLVVAAALSVAGFASPSPAKAQIFIGSGSPTGAVDPGFTNTMYARMTGWAVDPDTWLAGLGAAPIDVRMDVTYRSWYVTCTGWFGTNCSKQETVLQMAPITQRANYWYGGLVDTVWGPYHGFSFRVPSNPGYSVEDIKVTAVNVGPGTDYLIGEYYFYS
jgi:hypothetical protein